MSTLPSDITDRVSQLLQAIASQARLEILLVIGDGEACVCHLEAVTGYRQAYISQHLMALRDAGVITARRQGRYVYYRLQDKALLALFASAGKLCGISLAELEQAFSPALVKGCDCPYCTVTESAPLLQIDLPRPIG